MQHSAQPTGSFEWHGIIVSGSMEIQGPPDTFCQVQRVQSYFDPAWNGSSGQWEGESGVVRAEEEGNIFSESSVGNREQGSEAGTRLWGHGTSKLTTTPFLPRHAQHPHQGWQCRSPFLTRYSTKVRTRVYCAWLWYGLCSVIPMAQKQSQILKTL